MESGNISKTTRPGGHTNNVKALIECHCNRFCDCSRLSIKLDLGSQTSCDKVGAKKTRFGNTSE